jgi:hypothetical protein
MLLSICIPTYNRLNCLDNCLNSILISSRNVKKFDFEVCISYQYKNFKTIGSLVSQLRIFESNKADELLVINLEKDPSQPKKDFIRAMRGYPYKVKLFNGCAYGFTNHYINTQFENGTVDCFTFKALVDIPLNEELFSNYGKNHRHEYKLI